MSAGSLRHAALTFVAVSAATAAGIAYIHRGQRLEREVRPAHGAAQTLRAVLLRVASAAACGACLANPDPYAWHLRGAPARRRCTPACCATRSVWPPSARSSAQSARARRGLSDRKRAFGGTKPCRLARAKSPRPRPQSRPTLRRPRRARRAAAARRPQPLRLPSLGVGSLRRRCSFSRRPCFWRWRSASPTPAFSASSRCVAPARCAAGPSLRRAALFLRGVRQITVALSALAFFATLRLVPPVRAATLRRGLFGMDLNKRGTPAGEIKAWPVALPSALAPFR